MKKFLFMILIISLLFTTGLHASRNSNDILIATNALFNNYIQDVIGNKNDKNYGSSLVSMAKLILSNSSGSSTSNLGYGRTNANRNTLIQSDGVTNEKLIRTNENRVSIIDTVVDANAIILATNEQIGRTNRNRIVLIDTVVDNIESISGVITNIVRTNENRLGGAINHIHSPMLVYPTLAVGSVLTNTSTAWTFTNGHTNIIVPAATITSDFDIHDISVENISANGVYELAIYNMTTGAELGRIRFTKNATQDATMNVSMGSEIIPANAKIGGRIASDTAGGFDSNDKHTLSTWIIH